MRSLDVLCIVYVRKCGARRQRSTGTASNTTGQCDRAGRGCVTGRGKPFSFRAAAVDIHPQTLPLPPPLPPLLSPALPSSLPRPARTLLLLGLISASVRSLAEPAAAKRWLQGVALGMAIHMLMRELEAGHSIAGRRFDTDQQMASLFRIHLGQLHRLREWIIILPGIGLGHSTAWDSTAWHWIVPPGMPSIATFLGHLLPTPDHLTLYTTYSYSIGAYTPVTTIAGIVAS